MVKSFLAAALQCTSTPDPEANFAQIEELIDLAPVAGAELVGLPENFAFLGAEDKRLELAPTLAERCSRFLVTMARATRWRFLAVDSQCLLVRPPRSTALSW